MIEVKLSFSTIGAAVAFLSGAGMASGSAASMVVASATEIAPPPEVKAPPKPRAPKATDSAVTAATESVVVESKPAAVQAPVETPSPSSAAEKPMDYATSDLAPRIAALVGDGRAAEVKAVLANYGAKNGREVPIDKLPAFSADIAALEAKAPAENLG